MRFTLAGILLIAAATLVPIRRKRPRAAPAPQPPSEPAAPRHQTRARPSAHWPRVFLIALLSTALFYGFHFTGLTRTSATSAAVVDGLGPILGAILAHFVLHNDRLTWRRATAILCAFAGVAVTTLARPAASHAHVDSLGCLFIIIGQLINATGTMLIITYRGRLPIIMLTGCQQAIGGLILLLAASLAESPRWPAARLASPGLLLRVLWLACVSATAFRIWYGLVRRYKVTSLSVFSFLTGAWGAILSVLFVPEPFSWPIAAGLGLVIIGIVGMNADKARHERELPPEPAP